MIYLDYSATTPVNEEVLNTYIGATKKYIGNPNSLHRLGVEAKGLIDASSIQIGNILGIKSSEIIYTSGSSEANNLAIKGVCLKYQNRGKHIITTELEHSSVSETIHYLESLGFSVSYVKLDENGRVDLDDLSRLMSEDTILVSIALVSSEVGIIQPMEEISKIVRKYPKCYLHSDITQAVGKIKVNLDCLDLASLSGQKFYGMKGIGCLIKKENIVIESLIHGGKSTTIYRSGTPAVALIASLAKALRLVYEDFSNKYNYVVRLNEYLTNELKKLDISINSNSYSVPHIINISLKGIKSETMLHALEQDEIYVSTQTACSTGNYSLAIMSLYHDRKRASQSIRISLSYLTTYEEINQFILSLKKNLASLSFE